MYVLTYTHIYTGINVHMYGVIALIANTHLNSIHSHHSKHSFHGSIGTKIYLIPVAESTCPDFRKNGIPN